MGSLWMLVAGLAFAGMGVFAKLGAAHFSSAELVFYRSVVGCLTIGFLAQARGWPIATPHWRLHLGRGIAGVVSLGLYFHCLTKLPLATAVTLNYTSPLFLAVLTTLLLHERFHASLVAALALSFAGVVLLLEPTLRDDQVFDGDLRREPDDREVRSVHLQKECRALGDRALVVAAVRLVGRPDLDERSAREREDLRETKAPADLDQLAARHDDLAAGGQLAQHQQHGGGIVVDRGRGLGTGQAAEPRRDVIVALAACAAIQIVFERGRRAHRLDRRGNGLLGQNGAAEIGVQHGAREVEHAALRGLQEDAEARRAP